jgi:putative ABC transport system permease protein
MKIKESLFFALNMVLHSKLRSWLTIIGIVIGVASVISIVSIGEGLEEQITSQIGDLGADLLTISPGYSRSENLHRKKKITSLESKLTKKDVQTIKGISNIDEINAQISGSVETYYLGKTGKVNVRGVEPSNYDKFDSTNILIGRKFNPSDTNVIIIGNLLSNNYYEKPLLVNQILTIEGRSFRVIGILDDESGSIIMPINTAYDVIVDKEKNVYDVIFVKVKDENILNETQILIEEKLLNSRHVTKNDQDFTVSSNQLFNQMRIKMLSTITTFLTGIAGISLLVGAVGIANTMFTAVLEKTKEIGIMKAIGSKNRDVLIIFLFNAGLIGLVGGIIGIIFGYLIILLLNNFGIPVKLNFFTILFTIVISIVVGMISGFIPANQASKLKPVDALRSS